MELIGVFYYAFWREAVFDYSANRGTRWTPELLRSRNSRLRSLKQQLEAVRKYRSAA